MSEIENDIFASIIIPCYNIQDYIGECLDSLTAQTFGSFEAICVDDGSTDNTLSVLNEYAANDERIRVFHKDNGGVSSARNFGLEHVRGEFVVFVDGDDYIEPNSLEIIRDATDDGIDIVVFSGSTFPTLQWVEEVLDTRNATRPNGENDSSFDVLFTERGCVPLMVNKAYRASLLERLNVRFDERLRIGEDNVFQCLVFPEARRVRFIDSKLYHYRIGRADSAMSKATAELGDMLDQQLDIIGAVFTAWETRDYPEAAFTGLLESQLYLFNDEERLDNVSRARFCKRMKSLLGKHLTKESIASMKHPEIQDRYAYLMRIATFAEKCPPAIAVGKAKLGNLRRRFS